MQKLSKIAFTDEKMNFNNKLAVLILIVASSIFVLSWYKPGFVVAGAEEGLTFYNPQRMQQLYKYTWEEVQSGGPQAAVMTRYPNFVLLAYLSGLGISSDLLQILSFLGLVIVSAIFVYLLAKEIIGDKNIYCLLAALFYILNPFIFFNIWNRFLIAMFFFEALLPVSMYFLYRVFKTNNILYLIFFLISSFILSTAFSLPSNILTLWIVLFIILVSNLIQNKGSIKLVSRSITWFILFFVGWILINLWWFIPLNYQIPLVYSQSFGTKENLTTLRSISNQFPFITTITMGYKTMLSFLQTVISFVMLSIVLVGFKEVKLKAWKSFLFITVILAYFILNGSNFPTGKIFEFFFEHIPQLQLFRNPYEKFGITIALAYSFLFSLGIKYIFSFSRYLSIILVTLVFCLLLIPLWSGKVFGDNSINFYVKVPDDYPQINSILNQDTKEFRILHLPLLTGGGVAYNWPDKYFGTSPNFQLFDKPSLESLTLIDKGQDNYWRALREGFYNGKIGQLLKFANIKYLILHKDIDTNYSQAEDIQTTLSYLQSGVISDPQGWTLICSGLRNLQYYLAKGIFFKECMVGSSDSNWSTYNFLHFEINSKSAGQLRIDVVDKSGQRLVFDGKIEESYRILDQEADKFKGFILNLKVPSEKYATFSYLNIDHLEFYLVPNNQDLNNTVTIKNVYLDEGKKIPNDYWRKSFSTPNLDLYTVSNQYLYQRIYTVEKILKIDDWRSLMNFDLIPEAFFFGNQQIQGVSYDLVLEKPGVSFKRLNNTKYIVSIEDAKTPFWLIFSESFSPDWRAKSSSKKFLHFPINGYTNGYFINQTGSFELELEYVVQQNADKYKSISLLTFILILLCALMVKTIFPRPKIKFF